MKIHLHLLTVFVPIRSKEQLIDNLQTLLMKEDKLELLADSLQCVYITLGKKKRKKKKRNI